MNPTEPQRKRLLIAGAGRVGQALCTYLSDAWEIVAIDVDAGRLEQLRAACPEGRVLRTLLLDATSLLNLREAGLSGASWLAAMTDRDDANIEICRLALAVDRPPQVIGVVGTSAAQERLKELGADAILRPHAVAGLVSNVLEKGVRVAVSVGLGQGEVVEIPVLPSSPAADARVADLRARGWLVAAIYREGRMIVPHGAVVIRRGDRLLLTGQPDLLPHIADYLRAGVARFPLQFGPNLLAVASDGASDGFWHEVSYLAARIQVSGVQVLKAAGAAATLTEQVQVPVRTQDLGPAPLPEQLRQIAQATPPGCLVLPKGRQGVLGRLGLRRPPYAKLLEALPCPALLAAGSYPYRRLLLPVTDSRGTSLSADLAIDLARLLDLPLVTITVTPPAFVVGQEAIEEQRRALQTVREVADLYKLRIEAIHREGNPVVEISRLAGPGDLLVVASRARRRPSLFRPDPSLLLVVHARCSVMVLTFQDAGGADAAPFGSPGGASAARGAGAEGGPGGAA